MEPKEVVEGSCSGVLNDDELVLDCNAVFEDSSSWPWARICLMALPKSVLYWSGSWVTGTPKDA